ncbi:sodium-translocating pyrophosphatase [Candidatus Bathyarchaeota archaeon]|nr:sodium-translocating pyrophosphatase [Candidatus Bathyarchaeota archaeon]
MDLNMIVLVAPTLSILIQIFSAIVAYRIFHGRGDSGKMLEFSNLIKECTVTYLNRQFFTVSVFSVILAVIIDLAFGFFTALTFSVGSIFSAFSAYIGTIIAVNTNFRTARNARRGINKAFQTAFQGGTAIGLILTGFGILVVSGLYILFSSMRYNDPSMLVGLGFGASLVGLFARVGGGIYTKAADISADLVGKVEAGLAEDDPRNPAAIADQVGDNVGDIAGTGSDVFQSYVCTLVAAIILGASIYGSSGIAYPLLVLGSGLISSMVGSFFTRVKSKNIRRLINVGMYVSAALTALASAMISWIIFNSLNAFYIILTGIIAVVLLAYVTEYYTSPEKKPVKSIVKASETGTAINILSGLTVGLESTAIPTIIFLATILLAYHFEGLYGITLAAVGFLSINATLISMASYGPIVDNANGLITMSGADPESRRTMDSLDAVGNVTKAICKVYAVGTSVLAQVALFSAYLNATNLKTLDISNPLTIAGMLTGGMLTFLLCSLIIRAVSRAAYTMIKEIRKHIVHAATVIGDTIGDPLKDAAGPSLDIFINLIGMTALIYATHIFAAK